MTDTSLARSAPSITTEKRRESRECRPCRGTGAVVEDVAYDFATGEVTGRVVDCPACEGVGSISVFLYAAPPRRRW